MHQWQKFCENLSIDTGDIVETWKSGMHSVMPWPWTFDLLTPKSNQFISVRDAPVTKVWRKSVNRYWRYRGNIKLPRESRTDGRTHGRTTRKHIASTGAYLRPRLKNVRDRQLLQTDHIIFSKPYIMKLMVDGVTCRKWWLFKAEVCY